MAARLGGACRRARLEAGLRSIEIAVVAGVSEGTISKFENAWGGWRRQTDEIVAAYESQCGLAAGELWSRAVQQHQAAEGGNG